MSSRPIRKMIPIAPPKSLNIPASPSRRTHRTQQCQQWRREGVPSRASTLGRRRFVGVVLDPMVRDVDPTADPDAVMALDIIKEAGHSRGPAGTADQTAVQ